MSNGATSLHYSNHTYATNVSMPRLIAWCSTTDPGYYVVDPFMPPEPGKNTQRVCIGNPIDCSSGDKIQEEEDYASPNGLSLVRRYRSSNTLGTTTMGAWRHGFERSLVAVETPREIPPTLTFNSKSDAFPTPALACESGWQQVRSASVVIAARSAVANFSGGVCRLLLDGREIGSLPIYDALLAPSDPQISGYKLKRPDGSEFFFRLDGGSLVGDRDVPGRLQVNGSGFVFYYGTNETEYYDGSGALSSIQDRGHVLLFSYSSGRLATVTDSNGHSLSLTYDASGRLSQLAHPGGTVVYGYDSSGRLETVTYPGGSVRRYHYEEASWPKALTGITDENGDRYATWDYDAEGRAVLSERAGGVDRVQTVYDTAGNISLTNALGYSKSLAFSYIAGTSRLASATGEACPGCGGSIASATYDTNGLVVTRTDFNDGVTRYTHDARGLEQSRTEAEGTPIQRTIATTWHPQFRLRTQIDEYASGAASGTPTRSTQFTYDTQGNLLSRTISDPAIPSSRTWTYTYNGQGKPLTANGPRTDVSDLTTFTYYNCTTGAECGQVHTITNALGHVTTVTSYDTSGRPLTIVDENGVTTTLAYNARGWLTSQQVGTATTLFDHDNVGQIEKVTHPDGSYVEYDYDAAHRLTEVADNLGNRITYTLDAAGNRTAETVHDASNVLRRSMSRVFDTLGRLKEIHGADGQLAEFEYDANGNRVTETVSTMYPSAYEFDALNRLARAMDPTFEWITYGLNNLDDVTSVTDRRGLITSYSRNAFGEAVTQVSPDTGTTGFSYDPAGNLLSKTDARGITATYQYDALNRITLIDLPGITSDIAYQYDGSNYSLSEPNGVGRLTGVVTDTETVALYYDARGNLTKRSSGSSVTQYQYDLADRVIWMTYPSGAQVTYTRNANGRVTSVSITKSGSTTVLASSIVSQPDGKPQSWTLGNGLSVTRTFDLDGRMTAHTDSVVNRSLDYDDRDFIGKITDSIDPSRIRFYGYDYPGRLNSRMGGTGQNWIYDPVGNLSTYYFLGALYSTYTYPAGSNRLQSITGGTPKTFTYDAAGNTTSDGTLTFGYDVAGRLNAVTGSPISITDQRYNELGQRISKTAGGVTTQYVYDQAGQLITKSAGGSEREIVWLDDMPLAALEGGQIYFFHTDHLNTPQKVTNMGGSVVWDAIYDPFGKATLVTSTISNDLRFPGQIEDSETGLHQNWNRDYDPSLGRYLQSDPIGLEGGINTYAYVGGNPISFVDPTGLVTILERDGIVFDAKPGVGGGQVEHARRGPGGQFHFQLKLGGVPGPRIGTDTFLPLTPDDEKLYRGKFKKVCESLSDSDKRHLKRSTRDVFFGDIDKALRRTARKALRAAGGIGAGLAAASSNSFEEMCDADIENRMTGVCE